MIQDIGMGKECFREYIKGTGKKNHKQTNQIMSKTFYRVKAINQQ